jgi:hypothetical protein
MVVASAAGFGKLANPTALVATSAAVARRRSRVVIVPPQ